MTLHVRFIDWRAPLGGVLALGALFLAAIAGASFGGLALGILLGLGAGLAAGAAITGWRPLPGRAVPAPVTARALPGA